MTDPASNRGTNAEPLGRRDPGMPLWMKIFTIVALVAAGALVVSLVAGVEHGPGRHLQPNPSNVTHSPPAQMHTPPAAGHGR